MCAFRLQAAFHCASREKQPSVLLRGRFRTTQRFYYCRTVDVPLVESLIAAELDKQKVAVDADRYAAYKKAAELMRELVRAPEFIEFLTLPAYQRVLKEENLGAA